MSTELTMKQTWTERLVKTIEKLLNDASSIKFLPVAKYDGRCYGNLTVETFMGKSINVCQIMLEMQLSIQRTTEQFIRGILQFVFLNLYYFNFVFLRFKIN